MTCLFQNRASVCVAVLLWAAAWVQAAEWRQFRGPGGLATADDKALPTKWDAKTNIAWKTPLAGRGASSPIVVGDRIFLTSYTGYALDRKNPGDPSQLRFHLLCLKRSDGSILWDKPLKAGEGMPPFENQITWHGHASATPVADADTLYTLFDGGLVTAWDFDGKQKWTKDMKFRVHPWGTGASPVLVGDLIILVESMGDGQMVALTRAEGKEVWRRPEIGAAWNTPLLLKVGDHDELILSASRLIEGFNPANGEPLWKAKGIASYTCSSLVAADGVAFAIGGRGEAVAVKAGGKGDVTASNVLWRIPRGSIVSSPVYHDGYLYWALDTGKTVYCADVKKGELAYEADLPPQTAWIYASPILGGGNLYYVARDGTTYVVPAKPKFELVAVNKLADDKSVFNASPVPAQGQLLIRSDSFLYCIGAK